MKKKYIKLTEMKVNVANQPIKYCRMKNLILKKIKYSQKVKLTL